MYSKNNLHRTSHYLESEQTSIKQLGNRNGATTEKSEKMSNYSRLSEVKPTPGCLGT